MELIRSAWVSSPDKFRQQNTRTLIGEKKKKKSAKLLQNIKHLTTVSEKITMYGFMRFCLESKSMFR